jgi:DNA-binding transcriptional MerR regulator
VLGMTRTISALADSFGLSPDTLRYYERLGLLTPAERSAAGYRLYDGEAGERLRFIKGAQRMGLRLGDIKELLDIRDRGLCPCGHTKTVVERRLGEVEAEIKELKAIRRQLLELKSRNDACLTSEVSVWACATGLDEGGDQ